MRSLLVGLGVFMLAGFGSSNHVLADPLAACQAAAPAALPACLEREHEAGERTMENALGEALAAAQSVDQQLGSEIAVLAVEASQQAWAAYRDTACEARAAILGAGDAAELVELACTIELTWARAEELRSLASAPG